MIFASSAPQQGSRNICVDYASNHSYLESRSPISWTASAILKCKLAIFAGESDRLEEDIERG